MRTDETDQCKTVEYTMTSSTIVHTICLHSGSNINTSDTVGELKDDRRVGDDSVNVDKSKHDRHASPSHCGLGTPIPPCLADEKDDDSCDGIVPESAFGLVYIVAAPGQTEDNTVKASTEHNPKRSSNPSGDVNYRSHQQPKNCKAVSSCERRA